MLYCFEGAKCTHQPSSYHDTPAKDQERILDLVLSSVKAQTRLVGQSINSEDGSNHAYLKAGLSRNGFLLHWLLMNLERATSNVFKTAVRAGSTYFKKTPATTATIETIRTALETICNVLSIKNLSRLYNTTSERDLFLSLFLKPVYVFMESEIIMRTSTSLKMELFECIALAVKNHQQQANVLTSLLQLLIYFDHLPENLAELLKLLYDKYNNSFLTEEMLKDISARDFNANDAKGPKLVSNFIIKLSQVSPRLLLKQFSLVSKFLDGESFTLRCGIIEATANVLMDISRTEEDLERHSTQIQSLFDLIEERVMDVNPYCRYRAYQSLATITELDFKFTKRRPNMTKLAVQGLKDKTSMVRRRAILLVSRLISTHPFDLLHGDQLGLKEWIKRRDLVQSQLDEIIPPELNGQVDVDMLDAEEDEDEEQEPQDVVTNTEIEGENLVNIKRLKLTLKYYNEAITFIERVHEGIGYAQQLLNSKNKSEIIDSMNLFVLADAYGIEVARQGVRSMIHLVWAKGNNDEAQAIQSHLIACYKGLFFEAPSNLTEAEANTMIAKSLISLTYGATLAEITSLERLLCLAMLQQQQQSSAADFSRPLISSGVIHMLWRIYGTQGKDISRSQRRGAIIILGMLARADHEIAVAGIDTIVKIGLGELGRHDLTLAKYTCITLQRSVPENEWSDAAKLREKSGFVNNPKKFSSSHEVIQKLSGLIMMNCSSNTIEWFGVAEQAINAVYDICDSPDEVMSSLLRFKMSHVFFNRDPEIEDNGDAALSQLLFIVGHVALKTIVYLEKCELQFKKNKQESEKSKAAEKNSKNSKANDQDHDMELIGGGTSEDDFTEAVAYIREREMLYGENSLLAKFGPMVAALGLDILDGHRSNVINIAGMLCLAKFMCVSSKYCEDNLPILMTMLDRFDDPVIRSNAVLALGDIAVSFNHIMDDNTDFLYKRLHDQTPMVQRTCLMTLTFLILAGQVKVKEQLSEMAKCLEDPDKRIADLAKMFFLELSTKDNAIYNSFIDIFSTLCADENVESAEFKSIFRFLAPLVDKERYIKQLSEKLHARLIRTDIDKRTWDYTAFVLNLLPHKNEEYAKVIADGYKNVE